MQRVDLGQLQDRVLDVRGGEFAIRHVALDHDAIERTADDAQLEELLGALHLQLRQPDVLAGFLEFRFRKLALGDCLIERAGRDEILLVELDRPVFFLGGEVEARFGPLDRPLHGRARLGERQCRPLRAGFHLHHHLALAHRVATTHRHILDQTLDRAADLDRVAGLDQAVVLLGCRPGRREQHNQRCGPGPLE